MLQLVGHPPLKPAEVAGVETLVTVDGGELVEVEFGLGLEFDLFVLFPPVNHSGIHCNDLVCTIKMNHGSLPLLSLVSATSGLP